MSPDTAPWATLLPSLALVWPSNWGSDILMLTMAVSPSRTSDPSRVVSFRRLLALP